MTGVGRSGQVGEAVAQGAAAAGARLVIADVNAAALADRTRDLERRGADVRAIAADLAGPGGARQVIDGARQAFGGVDALLNVAGGFFYYGPFAEAPAEMLDKELAVNFKTAYFCAQAAVPVLIARGGGAIVNFASLAALRPMSNMAPYAAAKSAVAGLTIALARELHEHNIRVNAVAPATIRTAANVGQGNPDPSARYVEIDEVVQAVLFLAGAAARGITGQIVAVTGQAY